MSCPNDCSGTGICRTIKEISATKATKRLVDSVAGVNTFTGPQDYFTYRLWDADKHRACACDSGYTGFDCSARECPRGDDPLTNTAATCGGAACANEVQNFLVAHTQGAGADGDATYRLRFYDFNGVAYDTADFTLKTKLNFGAVANAAAKAAVEAGVKAALEALPNNVTGLVAVAASGDATASENLRFAVTFTSLSGNVPDMNVLQGSAVAAQGSPAIVQPFQRVQVVTIAGLGTTSTLGATLFPLNLTTVRKDTALTAKATGGAVVDDTVTDAAVAAANAVGVVNAANVQAALLGAVRNVPAVAYYGQNSVSARTVQVGATNAYTTTLILPNADFGTNLLQWTIGTAGAVTANAQWSTDGNKEYSVCSNRGMCDSSSGLCKCFTGYYGAACDQVRLWVVRTAGGRARVGVRVYERASGAATLLLITVTPRALAPQTHPSLTPPHPAHAPSLLIRSLLLRSNRFWRCEQPICRKFATAPSSDSRLRV